MGQVVTLATFPFRNFDLAEFSGLDAFAWTTHRPGGFVVDVESAFALPVAAPADDTPDRTRARNKVVVWSFVAGVTAFLSTFELDTRSASRAADLGRNATVVDAAAQLVYDLSFDTVLLAAYFLTRAALAATPKPPAALARAAWALHSVAVPLCVSGVLRGSWTWRARFRSIVCCFLGLQDVVWFRTIVLWPHVVYPLGVVVLQQILGAALRGTTLVRAAVECAWLVWCFGAINCFDYYKEDTARPKYSVIREAPEESAAAAADV